MKAINNLTLVQSADTLQTGGYIMNDCLILEDGQCLVITTDGIYLFPTFQEYDNGTDNFKFIER